MKFIEKGLQIAFVLATLAVIGCTSHGQRYAPINTVSGLPERTFLKVTPKDLRAMIAVSCERNKYSTDVNGDQVICSKQVEDIGQNLLATLMTNGNGYSSTPELYQRFTIMEVSGGVRVSVNSWVQSSNVYGKTTKSDVPDRNNAGRVQAFLDSIIDAPAPSAQSTGSSSEPVGADNDAHDGDASNK